jgi:hypothetical protein
MNTKPQAPGQWAQQQKVAEKKKAEKPPQMEQGAGAEPTEEPAKKHGDKIKPSPGKPTTPEDQGGIAGP